jgi:hypothetical protein
MTFHAKHRFSSKAERSAAQLVAATADGERA